MSHKHKADPRLSSLALEFQKWLLKSWLPFAILSGVAVMSKLLEGVGICVRSLLTSQRRDKT